MRKQVFGRKFKRDANERKALFKGLINDLVLKESIHTTEEKAKSVKGQVEKLITKAKVKGVAAQSLLQPYLTPVAIEKVIGDLAVRFAKRPGGYTRVVKTGARFADNANMAVIEFVEKKTVEEVASEVKTPKPAARKATEKVEKEAPIVKEEKKKAAPKKPAKAKKESK